MYAHVVHQEVGSPLHDGVITLQQCFVARKQVLLPDVCRQPRTSRRKHAPCRTIHRSGNAPQICIVVSHPSSTTIHHVGCLASRLTQVTNHVEQGFLCLHKVAHHGGPVVHLSIDIDGVFRVPRGIHLVVPHPLQIGCLSTRLRRADQEVAPILHHERHHIKVAAVKRRQPLIRRTSLTSTTKNTS